MAIFGRSKKMLRLMRDPRAVAAVEFALSAPLLLLIYLGSLQLSDAIAARRKLTITTRALADLTTQFTSISASYSNEILNASAKVMAPYDSSSGTYRISHLKIDGAGLATVTWSRSLGGTARVTNSTVSLPSGSAQPNSYLIMAETTYSYVPTVGSQLIGTIAMQDTIVMLPRRSDSITCTDCPAVT